MGHLGSVTQDIWGDYSWSARVGSNASLNADDEDHAYAIFGWGTPLYTLEDAMEIVSYIE